MIHNISVQPQRFAETLDRHALQCSLYLEPLARRKYQDSWPTNRLSTCIRDWFYIVQFPAAFVLISCIAISLATNQQPFNKGVRRKHTSTKKSTLAQCLQKNAYNGKVFLACTVPCGYEVTYDQKTKIVPKFQNKQIY
jgi:hypothetical protein